MTMHNSRLGRGKPLLLVHGLGGTNCSWAPISNALAEFRELILLDLPGHGRSPEEADSGTFEGLARSLDTWLGSENLVGVDMVGSSMGARLVLEMARRGRAGAVVALDPGGFWQGWERSFFKATIGASIRVVRAVRSVLPILSRNVAVRSALMAQLSAKPWALDPLLVSRELEGFARTRTFDALVRNLATGPMQQGSADARPPVVIGWGCKDRLCLPRQAKRAKAAFPKATIRWFEHSGHFPMWDQPHETIQTILDATNWPK